MQSTHQHEYILRAPQSWEARDLQERARAAPQQTVHIGCTTSIGAAEPIRSVLCTGYLWSDQPGAWVWTHQSPTTPAPGYLCPRCAKRWRALDT